MLKSPQNLLKKIASDCNMNNNKNDKKPLKIGKNVKDFHENVQDAERMRQNPHKLKSD